MVIQSNIIIGIMCLQIEINGRAVSRLSLSFFSRCFFLFDFSPISFDSHFIGCLQLFRILFLSHFFLWYYYFITRYASLFLHTLDT